MEEYNIYGILYINPLWKHKANAVVSAESNTEAINMLEKTLIEDKDYNKNIKGNLNPEVIEILGVKASEKFIFGYDIATNSLL